MTLITLFFVIYVTTTTIRKKINIFCTSKIEVEEQEKGNQARKIEKKRCVFITFFCACQIIKLNLYSLSMLFILGRKRNEVRGLQDTLHPGNVLGKKKPVRTIIIIFAAVLQRLSA